jgi:hypothetical protein
LKCILEVATVAATVTNPDVPGAPLTIAALKQTVNDNILKEWEKIWLANPHQNPTYCALHHPPLGQALEFISEIESFAHPIFCTAIRLLTNHTFTGKYNVRHHPCASNPHDCQCGLTLLQTADHIITHCPLFNEAQEVLLQPVDPDLSPPIIFRTKVGGTHQQTLEIPVDTVDIVDAIDIIVVP